jgi:hypothetical protein
MRSRVLQTLNVNRIMRIKPLAPMHIELNYFTSPASKPHTTRAHLLGDLCTGTASNALRMALRTTLSQLILGGGT